MPTLRRNVTSGKQEKEASLRIILDEQRRDSDYLLHIFDRLRATESILLTVGYGILSFLYYSVATSTEDELFKRFFIPEEDYGKVIYFIAAAFFFYGLIKLTLTLFGKNYWQTAYEDSKTDYNHESTVSVLEYYKKRYDDCTAFNGKRYNKRKDNLTFLFFCILVSGIILIVIKTMQ